MDDIPFVYETATAAFLLGEDEARVPLTLRRDPLLGHTSIDHPKMREKAELFFPKLDPGLIETLAQETRRGCLLCEGLEKTPAYPFLGGRPRKGEAVLFPNLFPLAKYHAVIRLCEAHFLWPREWAPYMGDALELALDFAAHVLAMDPEAAFFTVSANYLFPAGASLFHPHLQVLISQRPYGLQARTLEAAQAFEARTGRPFFTALVEKERALGERYGGVKGRWHWLSAFAPLGGHEVLGVGADRQGLAEGLGKVLGLYQDLGQVSFNFTLYGQRGGGPWHLRAITRQNPAPYYRNDDYFLQKLLHTELVLFPPEALAAMLRETLGG